jgi:GAF domain-containing protein
VIKRNENKPLHLKQWLISFPTDRIDNYSNPYFYQKMFEKLHPEITAILQESDKPVEDRLQNLCDLLKAEIPHYDWVGFYFRNGEREELKLGPYAGAPTDHTIIPFGKGICGQVAVSNANFVVPDVTAQDNYIACSITVKAEIVVPLFVKGKNIGQIDIDSNTPDPFTPKDERFLEFVNREVAKIL